MAFGFKVGLQALRTAVGAAAKVTEKRSPQPIQECILMSLRDGGSKLNLTASSKVLQLDQQLDVNPLGAGEVCVSADNLSRILGALPGPDVDIQVTSDTQVTIRSGKSLYRANYLSAADYLAMGAEGTTRLGVLKGDQLKKALSGMKYAIASEDNRYGLNGLHVDVRQTDPSRVDTTITFVGTDGNRLAARSIEAPMKALPKRSLIPRETTNQLVALVGTSDEVEVTGADRWLCFTFGTTRISTRMQEAEFPAWREVVPADSALRDGFEADRLVLLSALKRVRIFAADGSHSVRCVVKGGELVLTARKLDAGDARDEVEVRSLGSDFMFGVNSEFFTEALESLDTDRVLLRTKVISSDVGVLSPMILTGVGGNELNVIMPLRLD